MCHCRMKLRSLDLDALKLLKSWSQMDCLHRLNCALINMDGSVSSSGLQLITAAVSDSA